MLTIALILLVSVYTSNAEIIPLTFSSNSWSSPLSASVVTKSGGTTVTLCLVTEVSQIARTDRQPYSTATISSAPALDSTLRPSVPMLFPIVIQTGNGGGSLLTRDGSITIGADGIITITDGARYGFSRDGVRTGTVGTPCITYSLRRDPTHAYAVTYTSSTWQSQTPLASSVIFERDNSNGFATACITDVANGLDQAGRPDGDVHSSSLSNVPSYLFPYTPSLQDLASFPIYILADNGQQQQLYRPGNLIFQTSTYDNNLRIVDGYSQLFHPSGGVLTGSFKSTCATYTILTPNPVKVVFSSPSWVSDVTATIQYSFDGSRVSICLPGTVTNTLATGAGAIGPIRSSTLPVDARGYTSETFFAYVPANGGIYGAIQYDSPTNQLVISRISLTNGLVGFTRDGGSAGLAGRTCITYVAAN